MGQKKSFSFSLIPVIKLARAIEIDTNICVDILSKKNLFRIFRIGELLSPNGAITITIARPSFQGESIKIKLGWLSIYIPVL